MHAADGGAAVAGGGVRRAVRDRGGAKERVGTNRLRIHLGGRQVVSTVGSWSIGRRRAARSFLRTYAHRRLMTELVRVRRKAAVMDAMQQRAEAARAGGVRE